ncbi:hypothetical protein [Undibacterium sp. Ji22W]|uniref:hypothetical protein n=1 Tax=Undibacterium sp. Ji22W TaxID=3413038 RepID=UPI003BF2AE72
MMRQFNSHSLPTSTDKAFNFNNLPTISAFPKDEKNWRIDWFGEIAFPNRLIRRKQPSVLVHLSRVFSDRYEEDQTILLSPKSTSPARFQRKIWISVGTLPLLRIGDIWRNGQLDSQPDYELEKFPDTLINRDTTHLVKAGLNLNDKGFLLPLAEHPWHMHCTQSYCVVVELADNRRIIVPCIELIRFYFGSSSNLIAKLFQPPLERKSLYSNAHFDKSSGRLTLELADHISGASAADIARIHQSKAAWHAAVQISTSILAASLNRQEIHPQGLFPFEGFTVLVAAGKWLSFEDNPRATFIVFNLRTCSHPFPFRSLRYEAKKKSDEANNSTPTSASSNTQIRRAAKDSINQNLVERDASNSLASKSKPIRLAPRFPDLTKKSIWKNKVLLDSEDLKCGYVTTASSVQNTSVGEPGSEQRIRSIDLTVLLNKDLSKHQPVPDFLKNVVSELMQLTDLTVELLTGSEEDGWTVPISIFSDEEGEIDLKLFIEDDSRGLRPRRVAIFSIKDSTKHFSAAIIEFTPTYVRVYDDHCMHIDHILSIVSADYINRRELKSLSILNLLKEKSKEGLT